jgi:hypothetical protein
VNALRSCELQQEIVTAGLLTLLILVLVGDINGKTELFVCLAEKLLCSRSVAQSWPSLLSAHS